MAEQREDDESAVMPAFAFPEVSAIDNGPVVAPLRVRDVVLDPVFSSRRDALLRTVPLHEIVDSVARGALADAGFDVRALSLATFDAVIARQGFPDPATVDDVLEFLSELAHVQAPKAAQAQYKAVAQAVLDGLTNARERGRAFQRTSVVYTEDERGMVTGTAVPRPFWLLRMVEDPTTGRVVLEASADAVVALIGGLDAPIADAQVSAQIILARQLERGDVGSALITAKRNLLLTVGFLSRTEELLRATRTHVAEAGWEAGAPELLTEAFEHLALCIDEETRLLAHVRSGRELGPVDDNRVNSLGRATLAASSSRQDRHLAQLTRMLEDSRSLHSALLAKVIGARGEFLRAQDEQMFRPSLTAFDRDLTIDVLQPVLASPAPQALQVTEAFLSRLLGPVPPVVLDWSEHVSRLLSTPEAAVADGDDEEAAVTEFREDPAPMVDTALLERTHATVSQVPLPTRLSVLLAQCAAEEHAGAQPADLVVTAALRAFELVDSEERIPHPDGDLDADLDLAFRSAASAGTGFDPMTARALSVLGDQIVCLSDGRTLTGPFTGADLVVCADAQQAAQIELGELAVPDPVPVPARAFRRIGAAVTLGLSSDKGVR